MNATATWRTEPRHEGFLSDGWYLSSDGRLRYQPLADPAEVRRRVVELIGEPEAPLVAGFAIDGRLPTWQQIAAVEHELHKAPPCVVQDFRARGGKIEVIRGRNARKHPVDWQNRNAYSCLGWYIHRYALICIAGEADANTTVHELFHAWDRCSSGPGRFSSLPLWRTYWPRPWETRFDTPWEKYAEAAAWFFHSAETRASLPPELRNYFEQNFDCPPIGPPA